MRTTHPATVPVSETLPLSRPKRAVYREQIRLMEEIAYHAKQNDIESVLLLASQLQALYER
jgi:hypothetical protein